MFTINHKKCPNGLMVIITDTNLLGKYVHEGNRQLDLRSEFYKGEELDEEKTKVIMNSASVLHLTGIHTITLAKKLNILEEEDRILIVQDIPHAEIVRE